MSQSIQFSSPSRTPHLLHLPHSRFHRPLTSLTFRQFPLKYTSIRASSSPDLGSSSSSQVLHSPNGTGAAKPEERSVVATAVSTDTAAIDVDTVTEAELKENGFRSTRRTKLICTIGPATCGFEQLEALAEGGMNVARLNMCHGTREWHRDVIRSVRKLNEEKGFAVAIMMDTEGSEIHMGDLGGESSAKSEVLSSLFSISIRA